jgi:O-antigen/teichoic acid export membrane protein
MLNTVIMAGFGFIFWMINARLFTSVQLGIGSTLISVIGLIVAISLLGMNIGLIRFLPSSKRKNDKINTVFTITILITLAVSTIFLLGLNIFSPKLLFIKHNLYFSIFFILSMIGMALSMVIESVYSANRRNEYTLLKNVIFSIGKIIFPFFLVSFGAMGIFGSWTISMILGFLVVFVILIFKFGYKFKLLFYDNILRKIMPYSFGNYIAEFISMTPVFILPLIILNKLSPETAAHYYISMTIANIIFNIPGAVNTSLFAEGSHNEKILGQIIKKSVFLIFLIVIPAIILIVLFGNHILLLFGKEYSDEGFKFLQILALSGVFISINAIFGTVFKVMYKSKELIFVSLVGAIVILSLGYLFLDKGLIGVGLAWILGQASVTLCFSIFWLIMKKDI